MLTIYLQYIDYILTIIDYNIIKPIVLAIRVDVSSRFSISSLQLDPNCRFNFRNRIAKTFESSWYESPRFGSGTRPELDDPTRRGQSNKALVIIVKYIEDKHIESSYELLE
jgi:hypothetical protein